MWLISWSVKTIAHSARRMTTIATTRFATTAITSCASVVSRGSVPVTRSRRPHRSPKRVRKASPARLAANASRKTAIPGMIGTHHSWRRYCEPSCRHRAEFGSGGRGAEAEEGERGEGDDQVADVEARGDDDRRYRAGEEVAERSRPAPAPASRAASRWGRAASALHLASHDPGVERPPHDRHAEEGVPEARDRALRRPQSPAPVRGGRGTGR